MEQKHVPILDIPIININKTDFVQLLEDRIENNEKTFVVTANPIIVMEARKNKSYRQYIKKANYITADGSGIVLASKLINQPLPGRVTGIEVMFDLLKIANVKHSRVYFLGAQPTVLEKMLEKIKEDYPNIVVAGSHHGFFDVDDPAIVAAVQSAKPDLIFVALGVPKQEQWIAENLDKFEKGIFIGIGGSFDVIAGEVKRAPKIWRDLNLEWLYRLLKQPSRWRRMLVLPHFGFIMILNKFRMNKFNVK